MIVRPIVLVLVLVTVAAVQTAVLPMVSVAGFRPDLLLLTTIAVAVHDGAESGVRVGFSAGLLGDLLVQTSTLGVGAMTFALVGYLVGIARPYLAAQSITAPLLLALGGSVLGTGLLGMLSAVLGDVVLDGRLLLTTMLFVGLVHTALITVLLPAVRAVSTRFPAEGTPVTR